MSRAKRSCVRNLSRTSREKRLFGVVHCSSPGDQNSEDVSIELLVLTCSDLEDVSSETLGFIRPGCPSRCLA
eukprot:969839-Pyramimonas_sp.AAC.1